MLNWFKEKKTKPVEYPVFNLEIIRNKTVFPDLVRVCKTSKYIGEFIVQNSGRLERGRDNSLHIYKTNLEYCEDHIHFPNGYPINITMKEGYPTINTRFKNTKFTLNGFYSHIGGNDNLNTQEKLIEKIKEFNSGFQFNSIAKHKETKRKLLEHQYKKYVSNQ